MSWTAADFDRYAQALVASFESLSHRYPQTLYQWRLEKSDCYYAGFPDGQRLYLNHPPVTRHTASSIDRISALRGEESLLEDDSLGIHDPNIYMQLEKAEDNNAEEKNFRDTEWRFSVVYSETWQVPVLYFTVQEQGGSPCSRTQVVEILAKLHPPNQEWVDDSWDFVSFEEHPITGIPSCFLHPCQTAARLHLLDFQSPEGYATDKQKQLCPLLSYVSLILPSVGFGIPPEMYMELLSELTRVGHYP